MANEADFAWVTAVRARGWGGALAAALDVLEPFGALGAQVVYVAQPFAGLFGGRSAAAALAEALETPEGITQLRRLLEGDADGG